MSELTSAVENFITVIKGTDEYQAYLRERDKVSRYPELKQRIDEYRTKSFELQNLTGDELFQKIEEFSCKYEKFREDPLVSDFLEAELDFCRMMQDLTTKITAALDFD